MTNGRLRLLWLVRDGQSYGNMLREIMQIRMEPIAAALLLVSGKLHLLQRRGCDVEGANVHFHGLLLGPQEVGVKV